MPWSRRQSFDRWSESRLISSSTTSSSTCRWLKTRSEMNKFSFNLVLIRLNVIFFYWVKGWPLGLVGTMLARKLSSLNMTYHISSFARACYFHLYQIWPVKRCLSVIFLCILVQGLVIPRLDYCNSVLSGLPSSTVQPLSSVVHRCSCNKRSTLEITSNHPATIPDLYLLFTFLIIIIIFLLDRFDSGRLIQINS